MPKPMNGALFISFWSMRQLAGQTNALVGLEVREVREVLHADADVAAQIQASDDTGSGARTNCGIGCGMAGGKSAAVAAVVSSAVAPASANIFARTHDFVLSSGRGDAPRG